ncbi:MAG: hypothetical protein RL264_2194 [Bacteroidota bacterium]|jgi:RNA polymerase sigma-70 factor (ECF subfamily)
MILSLFRYTTQSLSDEQLVSNIREQNKATECTGELYRRYGHLVFGVGMKYLHSKEDVEDLTSDIFIALPKKIAAHQIQYFKGWLYMLVKNECLMLLRKKKQFVSDELLDNHSIEDEQDSPLLLEENLELLEETLTQLKPDQQRCIRLFYLEKKSYDHISQETGFTLKEVKSFIQNGKRNLKIALENKINK